MRVMVIGANGFVGKSIVEALSTKHDVRKAARKSMDDYIHINLLEPKTIRRALSEAQPEVVVQCAGVVENNEHAKQNPLFTHNLLTEVVKLSTQPKVIICGSAAEYGFVKAGDLPVKESTARKATSLYGLSKIEETNIALRFRDDYMLPVVVARIFNPIGVGMHKKFLIPKLLQQIKEISEGERTALEVTRLDSKRDYINVQDIARGIKALIETSPLHAEYNIGSGVSTSNGEIIELLVKSLKTSRLLAINETSHEPEELVANQADISRMKNEFGWKPGVTLDKTIREIVDATNK